MIFMADSFLRTSSSLRDALSFWENWMSFRRTCSCSAWGKGIIWANERAGDGGSGDARSTRLSRTLVLPGLRIHIGGTG